MQSAIIYKYSKKSSVHGRSGITYHYIREEGGNGKVLEYCRTNDARLKLRLTAGVAPIIEHPVLEYSYGMF